LCVPKGDYISPKGEYRWLGGQGVIANLQRAKENCELQMDKKTLAD